jgi:glycosyltransferase involved in cell wall biosynthesis
MMTQKSTLREKEFPSFSIILETENLANADLKGLVKSLKSLSNQDFSPTLANEVWLIESGDTPVGLLDQLCQEYPWIKVYQAPLSTGYYKAKMLGAELSTGEIVVYFDSDCLYESNWLRTILETFRQDQQIQVVAGETMTRGLGIYETAMVITYIFPPFSGQKTISETSQYFLNNVAFRREFLLENSIPLDLPLYRGNCAIHAYNIRQSGYKICKQPQARATHAPPSGLSHFFWRFLLIGHDYYWQKKLFAKFNEKSLSQNQDNFLSGIGKKLQIFRERLQLILANDPKHLWYLPFTFPIVFCSVFLIVIGYIITTFKSDFLLKTYEQILEDSP